MGSNACLDKDVQKTLRNTTNVFHYQTSILLIYRNLFAFCSLWKPSDDRLCLHVISFVTTLSYHKSGARTELWHMHKSSVDLNGASSTLYDFLSQNRMTESHTHTEVIVLSLCLCRGAIEPLTVTRILSVFVLSTGLCSRCPLGTDCRSTGPPYPTFRESIQAAEVLCFKP